MFDRFRLGVIVFSVTLATATPGYAQENDTADVTADPNAQDESPHEDVNAARDAFIMGEAAANEGRWSDSLSDFQRSYLLSGAPVALYNAAMALRALGRHREARDAFDQLANEYSGTDVATAAEEKREQESARVAVLLLAGLDPSAAYAIRVDGRDIDAEIESPTLVEADPGRRGIVAEREGYEAWTWEGELQDGEERSLNVEMTAIPSESRSILKNPVFWIITGVVLVGAGVGMGIFLQNNAQLDPTTPDNSLRL